jgi:flagellar hook-associated protein 2
VSDETIATAMVDDGIAASAFDLEVTQKAQYNSWQTVGVASESSIIYTEPETGITGSDSAVTTQTETMDILYGSAGNQQTISINLNSGLSLNGIADAINSSDNNKDTAGDRLINASVEENDGEYYIRLSAFAGGDDASEQISLSGFDYAKADTVIGITRADSEDPMYLSIAPGTTYAETANLINGAVRNPGVTAAIIDTGEATDPYRLTLTSNDTGEKSRISIQNLPMTEVNGADGDSLNASFSINGVSYQRQTNEAINDVISGVSLTLKKTGETTVSIQKNTDPVKETILSLVEQYNDLLAEIKGTGAEATAGTDTTTDETDENPFKNDYNAAGILNKLKSLFTTSIDASFKYKNLTDIGIEINRDGTMSLDETELDQAIASDPDAIAKLFIGDTDNGITGLGDILNNGINDLISSTGIVSTEIDQAEAKMTRLDEDIKTATEQLDKRYEIMAASFVRLDTYIRQLNSESEYMQSLIDSFNSTNE